MRLIVFFDLPTQTDKDLIEYRKFRNFLIKNGFIMMQKSVYSKLVLNNNSLNLLKKSPSLFSITNPLFIIEFNSFLPKLYILSHSGVTDIAI